MKKYLNDKQLAFLFKIQCWFHGITIGKRYIHYQSGYSDKDGGGIVCYAEIKDFLVTKVTDKIITYHISVHLYNHNDKFAKEIGLKNTFIQKDEYSWGAYNLCQIKAILKAQDMLKSNFTKLIKPF